MAVSKERTLRYEAEQELGWTGRGRHSSSLRRWKVETERRLRLRAMAVGIELDSSAI